MKNKFGAAFIPPLKMVGFPALNFVKKFREILEWLSEVTAGSVFE